MTPLRSSAAAAAIAGVIAAILLGSQLPADPVPGFTFSLSPFTDEGWFVLGARNAVLLGRWATDELHLYLVQLPYHIAAYLVFELFGVGIVQARLVGLVSSIAAVALLAGFAARRLGPIPGLAAGIALVTSPIYLYYGRLALLEGMVSLFLVSTLVLLVGLPGRVRPLIALGAGAALSLAVAAKASALFAGAGIVSGWLAVQPRSRAAWARAAIAAGVVALTGATWLIVVALPFPEEVAILRRFWPQQPLPAGPGELWQRVSAYLFAPGGSDGAVVRSLPLLMGAAAGLGLSGWYWRRLDRARRVMVAAAVGWVVVGFAILLVVPYRPNRYVMPLLPPLALLTAAGLSIVLSWPPPGGMARRAIAVALIVVLAAPGLASWRGWMETATYRLPEIQAEVLEIVAGRGGGDLAAMEGGPAALFGMRVPAPAIVPRPQFDFNDGDLYASHGVRWVFAGPDYRPGWVELHSEAWEGRETVACYQWGPPGRTTCLLRLP